MTNALDREERAAIYAIKSSVFMEYPPIGNDIALIFAEQARKLDPDQLNWTIIWLIAKGRTRRFRDNFQLPDKSEMDAADLLLQAKNQKPEYLAQASVVYNSIASYYRRYKNYEESNKYYVITSDILR